MVASLDSHDLQSLRLLDTHQIARFAVSKRIGVVMKAALSVDSGFRLAMDASCT
jgi:hypothetical protein